MKVGIDWGGTKIEGIVLEPSTGKELLRKRVDAPKDNYVEIINKVCELINDISDNFDDFSVGIGMPGSLHPETGLVQVSNTKALEGQNVKNDLENCTEVIENDGVVLCDDYNLGSALGVKKAIDEYVFSNKYICEIVCDGRFARIQKI